MLNCDMFVFMDTMDAFPFRIVSALIILIILTVAAYRLYLHPLADVPGPRMCALTELYELWWDCIMEGQFFKRVQEMHDRYGKAAAPKWIFEWSS